MRLALKWSMAIGISVAAITPVHAEDSGFFGGIWEGTKRVFGVDNEHERRSRRFSEREHAILREYYNDHDFRSGKKKPLPPGLKKKVERGGSLPPGWQKKVARGEVLPEDVYRYRIGLPPDLRRRLPSQPRGTEIFRVEDRIVRIMGDTREIIDILYL